MRKSEKLSIFLVSLLVSGTLTMLLYGMALLVWRQPYFIIVPIILLGSALLYDFVADVVQEERYERKKSLINEMEKEL